MDFISKLYTFDLFSRFIPGGIFCILSQKELGYTFMNNTNTIEKIFMYYVIGVVINCMGSILLGSKRKNDMTYENYVIATKKDDEIKIINETANLYRSLIIVCMLMVLLILLSSIDINSKFIKVDIRELNMISLYIIIGVILFESRKRTTQYIDKRIKLICRDK